MYMKLLSLTFVIATLAFVGCQEGGTSESKPFCSDTTCLKEPMKFEAKAPDNPSVSIVFKDCQIDSIHWKKDGMGVESLIFSEYTGKSARPSKQFISCEILDGKYAWIKLNDCATGRGFLLKLPFNSEETPGKFTSAINNFDPKFKIEDGLVAYYDNTFIYVEDMKTGQVAKQLLTDKGVTDIDYDNVHSLIDSVNITKSNIYAKLKADKKEIEHNNPLTFK